MNTCNSNSHNSKNHLNQRIGLVPSEVTSKSMKGPIIRNHLNRTDYLVSGRFLSYNANFDIKNTFSLLVSDDVTVSGIEKNITLKFSTLEY